MTVPNTRICMTLDFMGSVITKRQPTDYKVQQTEHLKEFLKGFLLKFHVIYTELQKKMVEES
jgi:hypothetical protein